MKESSNDLWSVKADYLCVTTNSTWYNDPLKMDVPCAVMGAGCAHEAKLRYPGIDFMLGMELAEKGNHVHQLCYDGKRTILSFPVKHHWSEKADRRLIRQSCEELDILLAKKKYRETVVIPRPGCGLGGLDWHTEVRPLLLRWFAFNPRVVIVHKQDTIESKKPKHTET